MREKRSGRSGKGEGGQECQQNDIIGKTRGGKMRKKKRKVPGAGGESSAAAGLFAVVSGVYPSGINSEFEINNIPSPSVSSRPCTIGELPRRVWILSRLYLISFVQAHAEGK